MALFLGIDGGATHTTAWLAEETGRVLRRATAGPSNPVKVGLAAARRELLRAARAVRVATVNRSLIDRGLVHQRKPTVRKSLTVATRPYRDFILDAVCVGLSGVDRPQVHDPLFAWMRKAIPARKHLLTVDAALVLHAALRRAPGIIVIAGTGSIAYGQDSRGRILRAGGWGIPFDDLGSGYDLGRKAVAAALQDYDGRGRSTTLTREICRVLRLKNITQIVPNSYPQDRIAALSQIVLEAAQAGDAVARRLCQEAARDLIELPLALLRRYGWLRRRVPVVCSGGVFRSSPLLLRAFARHLHEHAPGARVSLIRREPVEGALELAREIAL